MVTYWGCERSRKTENLEKMSNLRVPTMGSSVSR